MLFVLTCKAGVLFMMLLLNVLTADLVDRLMKEP
jgi:hypothetical protein